MQDKEKVYFAVCSAILKLEIEKGHLKWSITDISKVSEITRSLIYYYLMMLEITALSDEMDTIQEKGYKKYNEILSKTIESMGGREQVTIELNDILKG